MIKGNRRAFLQTSSGVLAAGLSPIGSALREGIIPDGFVSNLSAMQLTPTVPANEGKKPLRLGLILGIGRDPNDAIAKIHDLGLPTCQVFVDEIDYVLAGRLRQALAKYQIEATSLLLADRGRKCGISMR